MKSRYNDSIKIIMATFLLLIIPACSSHKNITGKKQKNVSILGLGDSITEGSADFFSYLFPLDSLLQTKGYSVNFIGPRTSVLDGDTIHHYGLGGRTAEFLAKTIDSVYAAFPADIVLLHSGHNHFVEENPVDGIIKAQQKIIQIIKQKNPRAVIFVAGVITSGKLPKYEYIPELNASIKKMVNAMNDSSIIFVDQQQHWDWNIHTINDKVHPNEKGALVIANNWFAALIKVLHK